MQGSSHPRDSRYGRQPAGRTYGATSSSAESRSPGGEPAGRSPRERARQRAQERAQARTGSGPARRGSRDQPGRTGRSGRAEAGAEPPDRDDRDWQPDSAEPPERRHRRTPVWAVLTATAGAVLMLLSGGTLAASEWARHRYTGNVQQENLLGGAAVEPGQALDGAINILLLGVDARSPDTEDDVRSDTILVLHVPSSHDQAYLMSVPRDSWVHVPGYWDMKITEAFYHGYRDEGGWEGGTSLIAEALHHLSGLQFNAAAIVNFSGFRDVIDEMGGIEFCVETGATSEHLVWVDGERMGIARARREGHYYEPVRYEVGCQQMEGWQALDYVRQRKQLDTEEGDYARQRHQQQLLQAMVQQATSSDVRANLGTLDGLLLAAGDALIVDTNEVDMVDFLFTMRNIRPGDMVSLRTNEGWYNPAEIGGVSAEQLSPESVEMFRAAASDSMGQFVIQHPDFVNPD